MKTIDKGLSWLMTLLACAGMTLVASSCAHVPKQPPCVSRCGMLLEDKGNGSMSCDTLQEAEDTLIEDMDKEFCAKDPRMCKANACNSIFGYQLHLDDDVIIVVEYDGVGYPAVGVTNCNSKEMTLSANQDWRHGSYPHEIIHVVQNCDPGWEGTQEEANNGPGHEGWYAHGIYSFIKDYRDGYR